MKKIVPDPPVASPRHPARLATVHTHFASCDGHHPPLFAVCDGADIADALAHLASALRSAVETNAQMCDLADHRYGDLLWATQQSLEIAQALVVSLAKAVERQNAGGA
ncbi:hypothetical protein V0R50_08265 [Pseudomonas sp. 148P]|uniref:DUF3077 domain-containing protein n=1 Tax=Pseudomonas ulcerans TaxID=3115852 RepID=A0ABU7HNZ2_9PSED|nr:MULTISPECIES: hypothetical protein [unclassified Pseudomonas]MEE1926195.1 hypothetical protein [Pseudomonas sp. 147P]MEE1933213.1 hypothetical protein [Pseudomonas sp. 148P]